MGIPPELIIEDWYHRQKSGEDPPVTDKEWEAVQKVVSQSLEYNQRMTTHDDILAASSVSSRANTPLRMFTSFMKGAYLLSLAKYIQPERYKIARMAYDILKDREKNAEIVQQEQVD